MKIYLASGFQNKLLVESLKQLLEIKIPNIVITSEWINDNCIRSVKERSKIDYQNILDSDIVIAIHPGGQGTSSEMGYALGLKKHLIYLVDYMFFNLTTTDKFYDPLPAGRLTMFSERNKNDTNTGYIINNLNDLFMYLNELQFNNLS